MNLTLRFTPLVLIACLSSSLCRCTGSGGSEDTSGDEGASTCGSSNASSRCESVTWPRLVVAFGDSYAASFSYVFQADDGLTFSDRNMCPGGYGESTALHCDDAFYGNPNEKLITLRVSKGDAGPILLSRDIPLTPFNYCGNGIAEVVATTSDAGMPELSAVQYVDACSLP